MTPASEPRRVGDRRRTDSPGPALTVQSRPDPHTGHRDRRRRRHHPARPARETAGNTAPRTGSRPMPDPDIRWATITERLTTRRCRACRKRYRRRLPNCPTYKAKAGLFNGGPVDRMFGAADSQPPVARLADAIYPGGQEEKTNSKIGALGSQPRRQFTDAANCTSCLDRWFLPDRVVAREPRWARIEYSVNGGGKSRLRATTSCPPSNPVSTRPPTSASATGHNARTRSLTMCRPPISTLRRPEEPVTGRRYTNVLRGVASSSRLAVGVEWGRERDSEKTLRNHLARHQGELRHRTRDTSAAGRRDRSQGTTPSTGLEVTPS